MSQNLLAREIGIILGNYDPEQLIVSGCPLDEYEAEGQMISVFITNNSKCTEYQLADYIQIVFLRQFSDFLDMSLCLDIADEILKIKNI